MTTPYERYDVMADHFLCEDFVDPQQQRKALVELLLTIRRETWEQAVMLAESRGAIRFHIDPGYTDAAYDIALILRAKAKEG